MYYLFKLQLKMVTEISKNNKGGKVKTRLLELSKNTT